VRREQQADRGGSRCFASSRPPAVGGDAAARRRRRRRALTRLFQKPNQTQNPKHKQVIKVGTSSLIHPEHDTLNLVNLAAICETVKDLRVQGHHVVLVSSGAVGVGCQRLGLPGRPARLAQKQALAAVGQVHLMRHYADLFAALGLTCAQVLLTLDNLANRDQYVNARNTFHELLAYGAVPVVNENDTVAVQELRFGDNDTLSAQVAALVGADHLFLLTDVDALYTGDPRTDPSATPVWEVEDIRALAGGIADAGGAATAGTGGGGGGPSAAAAPGSAAAAAASADGSAPHPPPPPPDAPSSSSGGGGSGGGAPAPPPPAAPAPAVALPPGVSAGGVGSRWGTGGMATKLTAARIATSAGCTMVILSSERPRSIPRILRGEAGLGTRFHPVRQGAGGQHQLRGRRRWVLSVPVRGSLFLDAGAVAAVRDGRKSLFAAGVARVQGAFHAQDAVSLRDAADGRELARGLVSFSSVELAVLRARAQMRKQQRERQQQQQQGQQGQQQHQGAGGGGVCGGEAGHNRGGGPSAAAASRADVTAALGYAAPAEVVHRGNLALLESSRRKRGEGEEGDEGDEDDEEDEDEEEGEDGGGDGAEELALMAAAAR